MTRAWKTLAERQGITKEQFAKSLAEIETRLSAYGKAHHGRFHIFGSAIRGATHDQSDLDILVDFSRDGLFDAQDFAEKTCIELGITPDARPLIWASDRLQQRVFGGGRTCP